jgi:sugar lactone lactonase YvrE
LGDDRGDLKESDPLLGTMLHMSAAGTWKVVADVIAYEERANPGGGPIDSNPYGVLAEPGAQLITDAGGNALLRVAANGSITTVATFPSRAQGRLTDAVPTCVTLGPDGAYYVGELSGVPFTAGAARIYRVVPGQAPTIHLEGFKTITDLAFDEDGNLYVVEHASGPVFFGGPGRLLKVAPDGTRTTVLGDLDRPTSVAIGSEGELYVTNHGITAGAGEVLRIE